MTGWFRFPDGVQAERIATGRLTMFTVRGGDGPPVVFIHGLGWDSSLWFPTMAALLPTHRVVAADTRGHGETDKPDDPYSIDGFAADWASLLDRLGIAKACIVGLSQGGMIAQALAVSRPDLVSRLVVAATACRSHPSGQANMEARIAALADAGPMEAAKVAAESIFSAGWRERNPSELRRFLTWRCLAPAAPLTAAMRAVYGFDVSNQLPALTVPTLILSGAADILTPPAAQQEIAALIPDAELQTLPGAGHMIPVETPGAFLRILRDFLSRPITSRPITEETI